MSILAALENRIVYGLLGQVSPPPRALLQMIYVDADRIHGAFSVSRSLGDDRVFTSAIDLAVNALRLAAIEHNADLRLETASYALARQAEELPIANNLKAVQARSTEQLEEIRNLKEALAKEKAEREALQRTVALLAVQQLQGGAPS